MTFPVLTPNTRAVDDIVSSGSLAFVKEVIVFAAASEGFSKSNTNCTVEESLDRMAATAEKALALGLRVRLAAHPALDRLVGDAIELHMFDRGYAGINRQEDGSVNVCLAVRRSRLREAGDAAALLALLGTQLPQLGERLGFDAGPVDAVANVPYGWHTTEARAGLFRLGDQAGVIPSLAGEGMGIAVASGISAARAYLRGGPRVAWQADFARRIRRPIGIADTIRAAAERPTIAAALVPLLRAAPKLTRIIAHATRIRPAPGASEQHGETADD